MENQNEFRKCNVCGVAYPKTKEFFYSRGKGYLEGKCKSCKDAWLANYYMDNPKPQLEQYRERNFTIRFSVRINKYKVWQTKPWVYLGDFDSLDEAMKYISDK